MKIKQVNVIKFMFMTCKRLYLRNEFGICRAIYLYFETKNVNFLYVCLIVVRRKYNMIVYIRKNLS